MAIHVEMTSDEAQLLRGLQRLAQQQSRVEQGFNKIQRSGQSSAQQVTRLFQAVAGSYAVTQAISQLKQVMEDLDRVGREASQRIAESQGGRRTLYQIAAPGTEEGKRNVEAAERLRAEYGLQGEEAYRLVEKAASAGPQFMQQKTLDMLATLKELAFQPAQAVEAAQKLQSAFGGAGPGETGAGTVEQIVNKVLAAAGPSPVNAEEIARAMATAAVPFKQIGGQDEALLAFGGVLTESYKSAEAGAEKLKSLSDQLLKKKDRIQLEPGQVLPGGIELIAKLPQYAREGRLRGEGGEVEDLTKWLGESNAIQAMEQFRVREKDIRARLQLITTAERGTGTTRDELASRLQEVRKDTQLQAIKHKEVWEERRQLIEEEKYAPTQALAKSLRDELVTDLEQRGRSHLRVWMAERLFDWGGIRGPKQFIEGFGKFGSEDTQRLVSEELKRIEALERAAEKLDRAADKLVRSRGGSTLAHPDSEPK
jgi:hypothetical protein